MSCFKDAKKQVLHCLSEGRILHEARNNIDVKNLLAVGRVTLDDVTQLLKRSRGNEYEVSPHHMDSSIDVHVVKTRYLGMRWYIKWYFVEPDAVFISVHH